MRLRLFAKASAQIASQLLIHAYVVRNGGALSTPGKKNRLNALFRQEGKNNGHCGQRRGYALGFSIIQVYQKSPATTDNNGYAAAQSSPKPSTARRKLLCCDTKVYSSPFRASHNRAVIGNSSIPLRYIR